VAFRTVRGGEKELIEKLGRNDLYPCGSGRRFQEVLSRVRALRRRQPQLLQQMIDRRVPVWPVPVFVLSNEDASWQADWQRRPGGVHSPAEGVCELTDSAECTPLRLPYATIQAREVSEHEFIRAIV
jgi:hypothetical protein